MKLISHRGNYLCPKQNENHPEQIRYVIEQKFCNLCEVDIWIINNQAFFGHDEPKYFVDELNLFREKCIFHCKNPSAINYFYNRNFCNREKYHYFWHENDRYALTNFEIPICYPGQAILPDSIIMKPEQSYFDLQWANNNCWGICTDYIYNYQQLFH